MGVRRAGQAELLEDLADVGLDGLRAHEEPLPFYSPFSNKDYRRLQHVIIFEIAQSPYNSMLLRVNDTPRYSGSEILSTAT